MPDPSTPAIPPSPLLHAQAWADTYRLIDRQLSPLGLKAIAALAPALGDVVLDVGCGAGQTLEQLADIVGTSGRVIGIDVAAPLLAIAAERTCSMHTVSLIEADAQTLGLASGSVDAIYSRFGVMSFSEPVAAFANFHRMLRPRGRLSFVCWQPLHANELDHLPLAAAGLRASSDDTPFSLADPSVIEDLLARAGLLEVDVRAHSEPVSSGDLDAMTTVLLKVGALGKLVRENPDLRRDAEPRLRAALAKLGDAAKVELMASVWIVTARAQ